MIGPHTYAPTTPQNGSVCRICGAVGWHRTYGEECQRLVRIIGSFDALPNRACVSCGGTVGIREWYLSVAGHPFSAVMCPTHVYAMLEDVA